MTDGEKTLSIDWSGAGKAIMWSYLAVRKPPTIESGCPQASP